MEDKEQSAYYQKVIDKIIQNWVLKINKVLSSRSISSTSSNTALSSTDLTELLEERANNFENYVWVADEFDEYTSNQAVVKEIVDRVGKCFTYGIILADALIKEFSIKKPDKIGHDLKVTSVKIIEGDLGGKPVIQITYVASRLTFVVSIHTSWIEQQRVETSISLLLEFDIRSTDPSLHFPSNIDPVFYKKIIDLENVETEVVKISKSLNAIIDSQLE